MSNAIDLQLIADYGGNHAVAHDCALQYCPGFRGAWNDLAAEKGSRSTGGQYSGIYPATLALREPAIFGELKAGISVCSGTIGSGIAAVVCVATGTTANAIGVGGIPGILSIQPGESRRHPLQSVPVITRSPIHIDRGHGKEAPAGSPCKWDGRTGGNCRGPRHKRSGRCSGFGAA